MKMRNCDNVPTLLTQNQVVLDQRIGSANYDLGMVMDGHVFNFRGNARLPFNSMLCSSSALRPGKPGKATLRIKRIAYALSRPRKPEFVIVT